MARTFPTGWFEGDLLVWGRYLDLHASIARGVQVEVPDLRSADNRTLLDLRRQNAHLLALLGPGSALQVHWSVEDDFEPALEAYSRRKGAASPWCRRACGVRRTYYEQRIREGSLRREEVRAYLARSCTGVSRDDLSSEKACRAYLGQAASSLDAQMRLFSMVHPLGRWAPMGLQEHARDLRRFLNPSLSRLLALAQGPGIGPVDPGRSVRANCLRGDLEAFCPRRESGQGCYLYFDGNYHALFVLRALPRGTRPAMLLPILDSVGRGLSVCLAIRPVSVTLEIDRLRREIDELTAFLSDRKASGVENDIQLRRNRIESLLSSVTIPFSLLMVVRAWAPTPEAIAAHALAVRTALQGLDGAEFHQVNNPPQARHLFYETIPGYLGGTYRGWDVYVENHNLADLLPLSSSFCGDLGHAQALYDSPARSLVGVRLITELGTPQHTLVVGVNGAGKSALLVDLLAQTDCEWAYRFVQEEGLAFVTHAGLCGLQSLVVRESGESTINPFDTLGLPLSSSCVSRVVRTCMRLVGLSRDEDRNRRREALIGEYASALYADLAEDSRHRDPEGFAGRVRRALAIQALRQGDDDFVDAALRLAHLEREQPEKARAFLEALGEEEVARHAFSENGRRQADALVFCGMAPGGFPTLEALVSLMRHGRLPHHRSAAALAELDFLASELSKGLRSAGVVGAFIDGPTNVDLRGAGLHLDTSRLPAGTLKDIAGFVVFDHVRQHVLTLPRASSKVMVLDELRRILLIPGASEFVKELLAQMRKYRCAVVGAFQEPSQIDDIDPALTDLLLGQCKQYFLMRQNNAEQVRRIGRVIGLPASAERAVLQHPLVEHQKGRRASYFTFFSRDSASASCGTVRVEVDPAVLYVAESSGAVFDRRTQVLAGYPSLYEGVLAESKGGVA